MSYAESRQSERKQMNGTDLFVISCPASTLHIEREQRKPAIPKLHLAHATRWADLSLRFFIPMFPAPSLFYFDWQFKGIVHCGGKAWEQGCGVFVHSSSTTRKMGDMNKVPTSLSPSSSGWHPRPWIVLSIRDKSSFLGQTFCEIAD